jgi:hypothetical protein
LNLKVQDNTKYKSIKNKKKRTVQHDEKYEEILKIKNLKFQRDLANDSNNNQKNHR